jgi:ribonucleotide monophosphatase NagD (HAD superfamily)
MMVGDNVRQDVEGALRAGMRAALVNRGESDRRLESDLAKKGVPVIASLDALIDNNLVAG